MRSLAYFYYCSRQYVDSIHRDLFDDLEAVINGVQKRSTQAEVNKDLFLGLIKRDWSFDSLNKGIVDRDLSEICHQIKETGKLRAMNKREQCETTSTLRAKWHTDFAKLYEGKLVQLEVQFGKVESMFKDFCGFRIAYYEKRLSLGIEIVMVEPNRFFADHRSAISGMAYFDIAKETLPAIGLDCPILLLGIKE